MDYERKKDRERDRQAEMSRGGRDIGPLPAVANPRRRKRAEKNLRVALETYFAQRFPLAWSDDHKRVISTIEDCMRNGGLFALAMPRGSGKTTICEAAVLLAVMFGWHQYAVLMAATSKHATKRMVAVKKELLNNDLLLKDFPEVCHPIRKMGGIANRCKGQTLDGQPTDMDWGKYQIVLPTVDGSAASSAVIECGGLLEAVRGLLYSRPDGTSVRPTFALIDDPQTRRSARSQTMSEERERILAGDVLYLAGPGKTMSAVMPCTVIEKHDLCDRMLDRKQHPEWQGVRAKLLDRWPTNIKLWEDYAEKLREELAGDGDGRNATKFYRKNRKAMDEGAQVAWPARKEPGELSALQHAMNRWISDPIAFAAEMQNEPLESQAIDFEMLPAEQIAAKINNHARGQVPAEATCLTAGVDVQKRVLFWLVAAWADPLTGWIVDYGTWPDQTSHFFTADTVRRTIQKQYPGRTLEAQILAACTELLDALGAREWSRADGATAMLDGGLIDAGWGETKDQVYEACRGNRLFLPSHGRGIRAGDRPMYEWPKKKGQRRGVNWTLTPPKGSEPRHVIVDTNFWKTKIHERLCLAHGDPGSLTLFKSPPAVHRLLSQHLASESPIETEGHGRKMIEWRAPPACENHWLDALELAMVRASMQGVAMVARQPANGAPKKKRQRVRYLTT